MDSHELLQFLVNSSFLDHIYTDGEKYYIYDSGCGCCSRSITLPENAEHILKSMGVYVQ